MSDRLDQIVKDTARSLSAGWQIAEPSWLPITLHPKQQVFYDLTHREALFGGSAGGSKSYALLALALKYVNNPKYSAIIFRRTYADLAKRGALMDVAYEWLAGTAAKFNTDTRTWTFPSGATLAFGYMETAKDRYNYQGSRYNMIGFDELTQHPEENYTYLMSRLRRDTETNIPSIVRSTTNPGGEYHYWVKERFIPDGFTSVDANEQDVHEKVGTNSAGEQVVRAFVPSSIKDNPSLDYDDYVRSLNELDPVTRAQLLKGDWVIHQKGDIWPDWDEARHVITWSEFASVTKERRIPSDWLMGIGLDWGSTQKHPYVATFCARASENSPLAGTVFFHRQITGYGDPPRVVAERIKKSQERDHEFERTQVWVMSHEAKGARDTFVMDHELPFGPWKPDRTGGIDQVRDFLQVRGSRPDPFHPELTGSPSLYVIVADNEKLMPRTDAGFARLRLEMPLYHYDERGLPYNKELNDSADSMRGLASVFFPPMLPLSEREVLRQKLDSFTLDTPSGLDVTIRELSQRYHQERVREDLGKQGFTSYLDAFLAQHGVL